MKGKKKSGHLGSSFSGYLKSEGAHRETTAVAAKRVLAWQRKDALRGAGRTKKKASIPR